MSALTQLNHRRIQRFINLQSSTISYYEKAVYITTEDHLGEIINKILEQHQALRPKLLTHFNDRFKLSNSFRVFTGLLERIHTRFMAVLITNTREKILEYLWQAECKILQEIKSLSQFFSNDMETKNLLNTYQRAIENNFATLENYIHEVRQNQVAF